MRERGLGKYNEITPFRPAKFDCIHGFVKEKLKAVGVKIMD